MTWLWAELRRLASSEEAERVAGLCGRRLCGQPGGGCEGSGGRAAAGLLQAVAAWAAAAGMRRLVWY